MGSMDYQQSLDKLHSLHRLGISPGLERIRELLRRLGDPHLDSPGGKAPRFLHIAGTNGKGSVAALCAAGLQAAGWRVGLFTSPHLHHHCERYRLNGENMPETEFARLFSRVWEAIQSMLDAGLDSPTEFEAVTGLALLYFRDQGADFAVVECGLGGAHDSTNLIPAELAIITNVGLDHLDLLGGDVAEIAAEKAGIILPGLPVLTGAAGVALEVISRRAVALDCNLLVLGRELRVSGCNEDFSLQTAGAKYEHLNLSLAGSFQLDNAALAVQALELLGVDEAAIRRGLLEVCWPGRLEVFSRQPLIVLDGAHNEPGMAALAAALRHYWPGRRVCALLGMLADKQRQQALAHLLPLLRQAVITPPPLPGRSGDWELLVDLCQAAGVAAVAEAEPPAALRLALAPVERGDCDLLLICGSLYLLGEMRGLLLEGERDGAAE